jgi:hypothetical protein
MSYQNYGTRDIAGHHSDPQTSRFDAHTKYRQRGAGVHRSMRNRHHTSGNDMECASGSIRRTLTADGHRSSSSTGVQRHCPKVIHVHDSGKTNANKMKWWRVSIPHAGTIGKERVMSTLKVHVSRPFQPYNVNHRSRQHVHLTTHF